MGEILEGIMGCHRSQAVAVFSLLIVGARAGTMSFAEAFDHDLSMPKMVVFTEPEGSPGVDEALKWIEQLSKVLAPRVLPLGVTNTSENAKIFETFGIDGVNYTLPVVLAI